MAIHPTVRLMTWNVWWRFGDQWQHRFTGIASTLAAWQPDIVGLQECWASRDASQAEALAARLNMYSVFAGPSLPDLPPEPESADHVGIDLGLAVLSRWPIRHSWVHALPSSRAVAPVALVAVIDHPRRPLLVVCTCLEYHAHLGDDHLAQARELRQLSAELSARFNGLPVILLGDLNAGPDTPEIRALTEELIDVWAAAQAEAGDHADGITLSSELPIAPRGAVKQLDRRIDYILVRPPDTGVNPNVRQANILTDAVYGVHPSDHFAVVADLEI
jgi:endonuclease/exonuclease/phosphatase family metal-dependent hydrolase